MLTDKTVTIYQHYLSRSWDKPGDFYFGINVEEAKERNGSYKLVSDGLVVQKYHMEKVRYADADWTFTYWSVSEDPSKFKDEVSEIIEAIKKAL